MAHINIHGYTNNSCYVDIGGLQHSQNEYGGFKIYCNGSSKYISVISSYAGNDSGNVTFTGLKGSTTYTVTGKAKYNGTWYGVSSASFTTDPDPTPPPRVPSNINIRVNGLRVYITFSKGFNSDVTHYSFNGSSGGTTGTSITLSAPSYSTTYSIKLWSQSNDGQTSGKVTKTFTTGSNPYPEMPCSSVTLINRYNNSLKIKWGSSSNTSNYELGYKKHSSSTFKTVSLSSTSYSLIGLQRGTNYDLKVRAIKNGYKSNYTTVKTYSTNPDSPTIHHQVNESSIKIYVSDIDGEYNMLIVNMYDYRTGNFVKSLNCTPGNYVTFTGLNIDKSYKFIAKLFLNSISDNNNLEVHSNILNDISLKGKRPNNFTWGVLFESGKKFNVTAVQWNSFTARINEFREYKNIQTFCFKNVKAGDNFKAFYFNNVITAINHMSPTVLTPSLKSKGDIIYASEINKIKEALNSIN